MARQWHGGGGGRRKAGNFPLRPVADRSAGAGTAQTTHTHMALLRRRTLELRQWHIAVILILYMEHSFNTRDN